MNDADQEALRRSDADHRSLAENVPHMVWMADALGVLQYGNARWREYTGHDASGSFTAPVHPSDRALAAAAFLDAARTHSELAVEVRFCRASDGAYRWNLVRAMPLLDAQGRLLRWYGTCTDVQDQRLAQEALREAHSRTNHFIATLSHELRNPLAALMASVDALEHALPDAERRRMLVAAIQRQSWHLKRLTDDLLDVSRITLGRIRIASEVVDLNDVCRNACADFSGRAGKAGVDIDCDLAEAPLLVQGDATRLRQCVDNLVSNAVKASSAGMRVRIISRGDARYSEVLVQDEGIGIEESARATLFLPFSQAAEWSHRGLGLGLSIVSTLVELHGGSVWADSAGPHRGATFGIRLPRLHAGAAAAPTPAPAALGEARTGTVVIVDDELDNAIALQYLLAADGHEVHLAAEGPEALALADAVNPDVVICDLGLPHSMDGFEVARRLRARFGTAVYLCAYSGFGSAQDIAQSLHAGFDAHVTKPATPRAIAAEVQRGLQCVHARRRAATPTTS